MIFYNGHNLCDVDAYKNPYNEEGGLLTPPTPEELNLATERIKAKRLTCYYKVSEYKNFKYTVHTSKDGTCAQIWLQGDTPKANQYTLAHCTLNTVEHNCGALHISYVNGHVPGFAKILLDRVIYWAGRAGYTIILGNTAGSDQNRQALPWFKKHFGAVEFGTHYKNKRSGNINIWFSIPVPEVKAPQVDQIDDIDEPDKENDE